MRETNNPSVRASLPAEWLAGYLADEMCGCDMYADPRGPEPAESWEDRAARFRQKHKKPKYRKRGWSDSKIERAVQQLKDAAPQRKVAPLRGVRLDVRRAIAELSRTVGTVRVLIHFFSGDIDEEPISADITSVAADEFLNDQSLVLPDVWYQIERCSTTSRHHPVEQIDVGVMNSLEELHEFLAKHFRFPEWSGRNWDAVWDCLRDPALSNVPSNLRVVGLRRLGAALPRDAKILREILEEVARERPGITVELGE